MSGDTPLVTEGIDHLAVAIAPEHIHHRCLFGSAGLDRLLEMIERKNRELKKREEELLLKEKNLEVLEKKILSDLQKIEEALARIEKVKLLLDI